MGIFNDGPTFADTPYGLEVAVIKSTYGKVASLPDKGKFLDKWGFVTTSSTTFVDLTQVGTNPTLPTTNSITHITGGTGDTQVVNIEGHYLTSDGRLVFYVQNVTLNGTNNVALSQPLARATRAAVYSGGVPTGPISVRIGSGGTAVLLIAAGDAQSEKCKTAVSYKDFWIITEFGGAVLGSQNADVTFQLQQRPLFSTAGVAYTNPNWRPLTRRWVLGNEGRAQFTRATPIIVGPNTDVRIVVKTSTGTVQATGNINGYLAIDRDYIGATDPAPA